MRFGRLVDETIHGAQPMREPESSTDECARPPLPAVRRRRERGGLREAVQRDSARRGATAADRILCRLWRSVDCRAMKWSSDLVSPKAIARTRKRGMAG